MRVAHFLCRGICITIVASGGTPLEELMLRLYNILLLDFFEDVNQSTRVFAIFRRLSTRRSIESLQDSKDNAYGSGSFDGSFVQLLNSHFVIDCSSV